MNIERFDFDDPDVGDSLDTLSDWTSMPAGAAIAGLSAVGAPVIAEDASGRFVTDGRILGAGRLATPADIVTVTLLVDFAANGDLVRIVLPLANLHGDTSIGGDGSEPVTSLQYAYIEAERIAPAQVDLRCRFNDPFGAVFEHLVAVSITDRLTSDRLAFTVECGPRMIRGWLQPRERFLRETPHIACQVPECDMDAWGFAVDGAKIRSGSVAEPEVPGPSQYLVSLGADETSSPELSDQSTGILATYAALAHMAEPRIACAFAAHDSAASGVIPETIARRLDSTQAIIPIQLGRTSVVRAVTAIDEQSGPSDEGESVTPGDDPQGTADISIGSGRSAVEQVGELCIELALILQDSRLGVTMMDTQSDTGGKEDFYQFSSRTRRQWSLSAILRPNQVRRLERALASSGGVRPVWTMPPFSRRPMASTIPSAQHEAVGPRKVRASIDATEA